MTQLAATDPNLTSLATLARWLLNHVEWLRHHRAGGEAVDEITAAINETRRILDRPGIFRYLPCPSAEPCDGRIRVTAETIHARCDTCEWETDDLLWLGRLLRGDEPVIVTAVDACHRLMVEGIDLSPATLRKWVERGKVDWCNPRYYGPVCQRRPLCEHDSCEAIRNRETNLYDLNEIRRVAQVTRVAV